MEQLKRYPHCFVCGNQNHAGLKVSFYLKEEKVVTDIYRLRAFAAGLLRGLAENNQSTLNHIIQERRRFMRSQKSLWYLVLTIAAVSLLVWTQLSFAQMPGMPGMPKMYGDFKMPTEGEYVIYKVVYTKNNAERLTKLSIVGQEKSTKSVEFLYWFEQEETDTKTGGVTIVKMLISLPLNAFVSYVGRPGLFIHGNPLELGSIRRMIMKKDKEQALEIPQGMIQMINASLYAKTDAANQPKIKNLGTEKLMVGKQSLDCAHMRYTNKDKTTSDVWSNAKVPLFGMVKTSTSDATFELSSYGTNAVTAITEEPKVLEIPEQK